MSDTAELNLVEQDLVQTDLRDLFRGAVKMTLESVLEEVVLELCGADLELVPQLLEGPLPSGQRRPQLLNGSCP